MADLESKMLDKMHDRVVRNFLDMVILMELRKRSLSSHDVITFVHNKFRIAMSPGTVYSCLYFLEKSGLIRGESSQKRKVYKLTDHGEETAKAFLDSKNKILGLVLNLFIGA